MSFGRYRENEPTTRHIAMLTTTQNIGSFVSTVNAAENWLKVPLSAIYEMKLEHKLSKACLVSGNYVYVDGSAHNLLADAVRSSEFLKFDDFKNEADRECVDVESCDTFDAKSLRIKPFDRIKFTAPYKITDMNDDDSCGGIVSVITDARNCRDAFYREMARIFSKIYISSGQIKEILIEPDTVYIHENGEKFPVFGLKFDMF